MAKKQNDDGFLTEEDEFSTSDETIFGEDYEKGGVGRGGSTKNKKDRREEDLMEEDEDEVI